MTAQQGETGKTGERGPRGYVTTNPVQRYTMLAVLLGLILFLAWRSQNQDAQMQANLHEAQVFAYESCVTRNANIVRSNALYDGLLDIERHNPFVTTSPETVNARIRLFTAAHLTLVDCGPKP